MNSPTRNTHQQEAQTTRRTRNSATATATHTHAGMQAHTQAHNPCFTEQATLSGGVTLFAVLCCLTSPPLHESRPPQHWRRRGGGSPLHHLTRPERRRRCAPLTAAVQPCPWTAAAVAAGLPRGRGRGCGCGGGTPPVAPWRGPRPHSPPAASMCPATPGPPTVRRRRQAGCQCGTTAWTGRCAAETLASRPCGLRPGGAGARAWHGRAVARWVGGPDDQGG